MFVGKIHLLEIFFTKLRLNLKSEASTTYLSYAWWILEPALMIAIFYVIFAVFQSQGGKEFVVFLACGYIPFMWFARSVTNASGAILDGRGLIHQVSIPKPFFPMLVVFQDLVKQGLVFAFMFGFLIVNGVTPTWVWLTVIIIAFVQLIFVSAIALIAAAITPFFPDFRFLIATLMQAMLFGSGIFYDFKKLVLLKHHEIFLMNPMADLIRNYRQVLMENLPPDWSSLWSILIQSIIVILVCGVFYRKTDTVYARLVSQ